MKWQVLGSEDGDNGAVFPCVCYFAMWVAVLSTKNCTKYVAIPTQILLKVVYKVLLISGMSILLK